MAIIYNILMCYFALGCAKAILRPESILPAK